MVEVKERITELENEAKQLQESLAKVEEQRQQIITRLIEIRGALVEIQKLNPPE